MINIINMNLNKNSEQSAELKSCKMDDQENWDDLFLGKMKENIDDINSRDFDKKIIDPKIEAEISIDKLISKDVKKCSCGGAIVANDSSYSCNKCSLVYNFISENSYSNSVATDCNVNSECFRSYKVVGKNSYAADRTMLKAASNYPKFRNMSTLREVINFNNQNSGIYIPKDVIKMAINMYENIKKNKYVFRKDGRKGVLSALIYYACYLNGISRVPAEIAHFSGIEEKFYSFGYRVLHSLSEKGIINIPIKINPINDYLNRYCTLLGIDKKYIKFLVDLINQAEKKKLHVKYDSKTNTKCVGVIFMICQRVPEYKTSITKEIIEEKCNISKTTFQKYYNMLCNHYKLIKKIFKKYNIVMPYNWKN